MRRHLIWEAALGFIGFLAFVALLVSVINLFSPQPSLLPGFVAAGLTFGTYRVWKAKP